MYKIVISKYVEEHTVDGPFKAKIECISNDGGLSNNVVPCLSGPYSKTYYHNGYLAETTPNLLDKKIEWFMLAIKARIAQLRYQKELNAYKEENNIKNFDKIEVEF